MDGNQHIESDRNDQVGDRPIRTHFNRIIITVLAIMAVVVIAAWLLIGVKGHNLLPVNHDSKTQSTGTGH